MTVEQYLRDFPEKEPELLQWAATKTKPRVQQEERHRIMGIMELAGYKSQINPELWQLMESGGEIPAEAYENATEDSVMALAKQLGGAR